MKVSSRVVDVLETYNGEWLTPSQVVAVLGGDVNPESVKRALQRIAVARPHIVKRSIPVPPLSGVDRVEYRADWRS